MKTIQRCEWTRDDALMNTYHDMEWGLPVHDDQKLFEFIVLDAFQAGLSWKTILYKRENFRIAFDGFNVKKIALYDENKISELLLDAGIIRNKMKIRATISNAKAFISVQKEFGTFDKYIWQFTGYKTKVNKWHAISEVNARTTESDSMSLDLQKRGFRFVGSTICYAFMQAAGMVNDHVSGCFRYHELIKNQVNI